MANRDPAEAGDINKKHMGLLIIISSPAGGGKDAVIKKLLDIFPNSTRIVTTTSRPPRPNDKEGVNYFFVSQKDFEKKISEGYFLEYNNCAGFYYGTPKKYLKNLLAKYKIIFTNIDVNGKRHFDKLGLANFSIFLLPENMEILRERAKRRGGMNKEQIEKRLRIGQEEINHSQDYDYRLVNRDGKLDETVAKIADRIKKRLQTG